MKKYKLIKPLKIGNEIRKVGEYVEADKRLKNKFIRLQAIQNKPKEYPYYLGGPWYKLSNGKKIRGKANAIKAEGG